MRIGTLAAATATSVETIRFYEREALLVKVHTDEPGLFGWGEAAMWGGPWATSVTVIERELAPLAVGLDPRRPEYIWERLYQQTYYHGRKGILLGPAMARAIADLILTGSTRIAIDAFGPGRFAR